jgi:hypothetical protein
MSHPLSKCFVYLFKIYLVYTDTSSAKLGKDIIVALAYKQDCEILTLEEKEFQIQYFKLDFLK